MEDVHGLKVGSVIFDVAHYWSRAFGLDSFRGPGHPGAGTPELKIDRLIKDISAFLTKGGTRCAYAAGERFNAFDDALTAAPYLLLSEIGGNEFFGVSNLQPIAEDSTKGS